MKKLTKQQIFNRAVLGVVRQGALSRMKGGECRYRAFVDGNVRACGVGQLIADDLYQERIEGVGVAVATPHRAFTDKAEALMLALLFSGVDVTDPEVAKLLKQIQSAHDNAWSVPEFVNVCHWVAFDFGLTFPKTA